ncbi:hypothetical protein HY631_03545 [Candidatus Uhrbacteria bacterium]|nr:hypothetical protein [Candidatus Uhrbacteria bacterium]
MTRRKPTALYRPFLREAWRLTWERKSLWVFGLFAALISTGGVLDVLLGSLKKVEHSGALLTNLLDRSFPGYELASTYIQQIQILGPSRMMGLVTVATLLGVILMIVATLSQGALILGLRAKKPEDPIALKRASGKHFWPLLVLAILNKLMVLVLMMLLTLPLFFFYTTFTSVSVVLFFLITLIVIPALTAVNIVYLFALIDVVHGDRHPLDAIAIGWNLFKRHWLATLEYGLVLFLLVFAASLLLIGALLLLTVPYAIIFTTTLLTGSMTFFLIANVLFGLLVIVGLLAFGGACVTFQYSAWIQFYARGLHKTHGKKIFSKILRFARD